MDMDGTKVHQAVKLVSLRDQARKEMPGLMMRELTMGGVELRVSVSCFVGWDTAVSSEHAEAEMRALLERMRLEAIHELGLEPQLSAWRAQVAIYREQNAQLAAHRDRLAVRVAELENEIASAAEAGADDLETLAGMIHGAHLPACLEGDGSACPESRREAAEYTATRADRTNRSEETR